MYIHVRPYTQQVRHESSYQSDLKSILTDLVPQKQAEVKEFRSQHGSKVMGEVTVDMVSNSQECYCVWLLIGHCCINTHSLTHRCMGG